MRNHVGDPLNTWRKLFLATVGVVAVGSPVVLGLVTATPSRAQSQAQNAAASAPVYEVASVKPDKSGGMIRLGWFSPDQYTAAGATLQLLIKTAYGVEDDQISGAPKWLNSERYDIEAKVDSSVAGELSKLSFDQRELEGRRMLQTLLADRYKLALHRETKDRPIYALVIAKNGPKLQEAKPGDTYPNGPKDLNGKTHGDVVIMGRGLLRGQGVPLADLVQMLSQQQLGRIVLDKTGLTGKL